MTAYGWMPAKRLLRPISASSGLIKGQVALEEGPDLFPGFSASGQDVWLPASAARATGPGIVLSAVGARCGKAFLADFERWGAVANTASFGVASGFDKNFVHYILNHEDFWIRGGAAQPYVMVSESLKQQVWAPELAHQRAIADFLDRETSQIDAFIAKNEELIALLTERRNAVTATAVTRGVDPGIKLQDSHVPWLGHVPAGWRAVRLKFVVDSLPGYAFASADFAEGTGAAPLLRGVNVGVGRIAWDDVVSIVDAASDVTRRYALIAGDLVVGMDRPVIKGGLRVAEITEADEGALLVQRVLRLRGRGARNAFLQYALEWGGFAMYIEPDFTGVSVPHMSEQQVKNFTIALPDLATQDRVIAHIRGQHASIDSALEAARRSVNLARERRAALISAAVTGKIDVGVSA